MIFIKIIILYYYRHILSVATDVESSVVTDVPENVMAVLVVTYTYYVLCDIITSACMRTFWVRTVMVSNLVVRTIVGSNMYMEDIANIICQIL